MGKHKGKIETQADIVRAAGYAKSVEMAPTKVLETSGVKEALEDLGFNAETAKKVVQRILTNEEAEDRDRLKAADMVFKVTGDYASDKIAAQNNNANTIVFQKIEQHVYNFESELKKALGYDTRIIEQGTEQERIESDEPGTDE